MRFRMSRRFGEEVERAFEDGEVIVPEGEYSREMYVLQSGGATVEKSSPRGSFVLRELERGDFFGEMALLESEPRSATVRARGATRVMVIQPGGFLLRIRRDPTFAFEVMQKLSHRVRHLSEQLATVARRGDTGRGPELEQDVIASEYEPGGRG